MEICVRNIIHYDLAWRAIRINTPSVILGYSRFPHVLATSETIALYIRLIANVFYTYFCTRAVDIYNQTWKPSRCIRK